MSPWKQCKPKIAFDLLDLPVQAADVGKRFLWRLLQEVFFAPRTFNSFEGQAEGAVKADLIAGSHTRRAQGRGRDHDELLIARLHHAIATRKESRKGRQLAAVETARAGLGDDDIPLAGQQHFVAGCEVVGVNRVTERDRAELRAQPHDGTRSVLRINRVLVDRREVAVAQ